MRRPIFRRAHILQAAETALCSTWAAHHEHSVPDVVRPQQRLVVQDPHKPRVPPPVRRVRPPPGVNGGHKQHVGLRYQPLLRGSQVLRPRGGAFWLALQPPLRSAGEAAAGDVLGAVAKGFLDLHKQAPGGSAGGAAEPVDSVPPPRLHLNPAERKESVLSLVRGSAGVLRSAPS